MTSVGKDSLKTQRTLSVGNRDYEYFSLPVAAQRLGDISRLPISLKTLLENILRFEDGRLHGRACAGDRGLAEKAHVHPRGSVQSRAHPDAGLHWRTGDC